MNKFLILTTINPPNEVVAQFSKFKDWQIVVVADRKTPSDWSFPNVAFLSIKDQVKMKFKTARILPWNSYTRKNLGYLYAMKHGADLIAETDDDNFPLANWGNIPDNVDNWLVKGSGFINAYNLFSSKKIWPRGFPLGRINKQNNFELSDEKREVGIWQCLINKDTDVDAIYRLTINEEIEFNKKFTLSVGGVSSGSVNLKLEKPLRIAERSGAILDADVICPFNSQNTFFTKQAFQLMYLPSTVTMRATDIYRGLVAQPNMWQKGLYLGFYGPSAYQDRNAHDFMKDFEDEIPVYRNTEKIIEFSKNASIGASTIGEGLLNTYKALAKAKIVQNQEIKIIDAWLDDVSKY
jgi:hypothetical protein